MTAVSALFSIDLETPRTRLSALPQQINNNQHNKHMKLTHIIPLVSLTLATAVYAAPESFDFKDPKGVNNAVFNLDAPLESVNGSASGITGTVTFDPENPGATTGKIVVAADSLTVPNPDAEGAFAQRQLAGREDVPRNHL